LSRRACTAGSAGAFSAEAPALGESVAVLDSGGSADVAHPTMANKAMRTIEIRFFMLCD
jgi:hypothetical protein